MVVLLNITVWKVLPETHHAQTILGITSDKSNFLQNKSACIREQVRGGEQIRNIPWHQQEQRPDGHYAMQQMCLGCSMGYADCIVGEAFLFFLQLYFFLFFFLTYSLSFSMCLVLTKKKPWTEIKRKYEKVSKTERQEENPNKSPKAKHKQPLSFSKHSSLRPSHPPPAHKNLHTSSSSPVMYFGVTPRQLFGGSVTGGRYWPNIILDVKYKLVPLFYPWRVSSVLEVRDFLSEPYLEKRKHTRRFEYSEIQI